MRRLARLAPLYLTLTLTLACADDPAGNDETTTSTTATSSSESTGESDGSPGDGDGDGSPGDGDGDGDGSPLTYWTPGQTTATAREPNARGYLDRRGLIHAHSVHSHDACDGDPKNDQGEYDQQCDRDFREGLCRARHDFVFLTDHPESYASTEYPETLQYRADWGDTLVIGDGIPYANWTGCAGFDVGNTGDAPFVPTLIQAGCEGATMPIGLPAHVAPTQAEREAMLGDSSPAGVTALANAGAVPLVAHTENWTVQQLTELPLAGFEMYNIHANLFLNIAKVGLLMTKLGYPDQIPHPDLVLLALLSEDPAYIDTWSAVLATGVRRLTTMGTDCHRNSFPQLLADGQRVDSYERMMKWFSNHLLVLPSVSEPNGFGVGELREALDAGRLFGVFELLGLPVDFDYRAEQGGDTFEIGGELSLAEGPITLTVEAPSVADRDPATAAPIVHLRLLRATDVGWEELAAVQGPEGTLAPLELEVSEPGSYRAEVRMQPHHLEQWLGSDYTQLADESFVWIYANPIYVRD
jgi:hypothetical protein